MVLLKRLINASDFGQCPCIEQMALGRLKIRPALLQIVQRRQRVGRTIASELGLRLAECVGRFTAHRQVDDVIVMPLGFVKSRDVQTLGSKRSAVGNRIGTGEPIG